MRIRDEKNEWLNRVPAQPYSSGTPEVETPADFVFSKKLVQLIIIISPGRTGDKGN